MLRGLAVAVLLALNLLFWGTLVILCALPRLVTTGSVRRRIVLTAVRLAERWVRGNDAVFDLVLDTKWDIEVPASLRREGRYLIVCNHLSWVDVFALFRAFSGRIQFLRFFLKRVLIWFPVAGQACWALDFPFMRRYTKEYLARYPEKRGLDLETTRVACSRFESIPVTIVNFVEGTRFTPAKHAAQGAAYRHLLRPRVGGVAFVLAAMAGRLDGVIDVTLGYPGGDTTMLEFATNRLERISVRARLLEVPPDCVDPAIVDPGPARERIRAWIEQIWREKDALLDRLV